MTLSRVRGFDDNERADKVSNVCGGKRGIDMCVTGLDVMILRMTVGPACMALKCDSLGNEVGRSSNCLRGGDFVK